MSNTTPATVAEWLRELVDRCERASGPDREIDAAILLAEMARFGAQVRYTEAEVLTELPNLCLEFTASLDAAMTLVPEGHAQPSDIVREALTSLSKRFGLHMSRWPLDMPYPEYLARHICAAALRARAHIQEQP